eukprot:3675107-Prymnesium_polylepis.1
MEHVAGRRACSIEHCAPLLQRSRGSSESNTELSRNSKRAWVCVPRPLARSKTRPPQPSPRGDEPVYSVAYGLYSPSNSVNPHKVSRARSHGTVAR